MRTVRIDDQLLATLSGAPGPYSRITVVDDAFLHLTDDSLALEALTAIAAALTEDGRAEIALPVPDVDDADLHSATTRTVLIGEKTLHWQTRASFTALAERAGLQVLDWHQEPVPAAVVGR